MSKRFALALLASASILCATITSAAAQSAQPVRMASNMGGGFIEFLFGDASRGGRYEQMYQQQPDVGFDGRRLPPMEQQGMYGQDAVDPSQRGFDPRYNKQVVDYQGKESAGTIVIDTLNKFLYLVQ